MVGIPPNRFFRFTVEIPNIHLYDEPMGSSAHLPGPFRVRLLFAGGAPQFQGQVEVQGPISQVTPSDRDWKVTVLENIYKKDGKSPSYG